VNVDCQAKKHDFLNLKRRDGLFKMSVWLAKDMFLLIRVVAVVMPAVVLSSQNGMSQDLIYPTTTETGKSKPSTITLPANVHDSTNDRETLNFRRRSYFYSWRDGCYTQDRNHNWYQVDSRLC
jgi:hypothetical protein